MMCTRPVNPLRAVETGDDSVKCEAISKSISLVLTPDAIERGACAYRQCSTNYDSEEDIVVEIFTEMLRAAVSNSGPDVVLEVPPTTMRPTRR